MHSCDQCTFKSTTSSSLHHHIRYKHEGVRFNCDICDYAATTASNLTKHKLSTKCALRMSGKGKTPLNKLKNTRGQSPAALNTRSLSPSPSGATPRSATPKGKNTKERVAAALATKGLKKGTPKAKGVASTSNTSTECSTPPNTKGVGLSKPDVSIEGKRSRGGRYNDIITTLKQEEENVSSGDEFDSTDKRPKRSTMNESPSQSKGSTTPATLRKSRRSEVKKSGNKNVSIAAESYFDLETPETSSTKFITGKVVKVCFFGSEVAEINGLNENEQASTDVIEETSCSKDTETPQRNSRLGKYSSSPIRTRKSAKISTADKDVKEEVDETIVKQETEDMELSQTGKRLLGEIMQESLNVKQELDEPNDQMQTRKKRKFCQDSSENYVLDAFDNKAAAPTVQNDSEDLQNCLLVIDDLEEKQKVSLQKEIDAKNKIATLENKLADDLNRMKDLEKRYEDLEKEKNVLAEKDDERKKENALMLEKITNLEKSVDEHKKEKENIVYEKNVFKSLFETSKQELEDNKTKQENSSKGLTGTLNDVTRSLDRERKENIKKDGEITRITDMLKKKGNEQFLLIKESEANKRKVVELEAVVKDMKFQQTVADQDECENIKKIQELKSQVFTLSSQEEKNKRFGEMKAAKEAIENENEGLKMSIRSLTEENSILQASAQKIKMEMTNSSQETDLVTSLRKDLERISNEKKELEKVNLETLRSRALDKHNKSTTREEDINDNEIGVERYKKLFEQGRDIQDIFARKIVEKDEEVESEKAKYKKLLGVQNSIKDSVLKLSKNNNAEQFKELAQKVSDLGKDFDKYETWISKLKSEVTDINDRVASVVSLVDNSFRKTRETLGLSYEVNENMEIHPSILNCTEKLQRIERVLNRIVADSTESYQQLKKVVEETKKQNEIKTNEVKEKEDIIIRLKEQKTGIIDKALSIQKVLKSRIANAEKELDIKTNENLKAREEINSVKKDAEIKTNKILELQRDQQAKTKEYIGLKKDLDTVKKNLETKLKENMDLKADNEKLKKEKENNTDDDVIIVEPRKSSKADSKKKGSSTDNKHNAEIKDLETKLYNKGMELKKMQSGKDNVIKLLKLDIKNYEDKIDKEKAKVKAKEETIDRLKKERSSDPLLKNLEDKLEKEKAKVKTKEETIDRIKKERSSDKEKLKTEIEKVTVNNATIAELRKQLDSHLNQIKVKDKEISGLKDAKAEESVSRESAESVESRENALNEKQKAVIRDLIQILKNYSEDCYKKMEVLTHDLSFQERSEGKQSGNDAVKQLEEEEKKAKLLDNQITILESHLVYLNQTKKHGKSEAPNKDLEKELASKDEQIKTLNDKIKTLNVQCDSLRSSLDLNSKKGQEEKQKLRLELEHEKKRLVENIEVMKLEQKQNQELRNTNVTQKDSQIQKLIEERSTLQQQYQKINKDFEDSNKNLSDSKTKIMELTRERDTLKADSNSNANITQKDCQIIKLTEELTQLKEYNQRIIKSLEESRKIITESKAKIEKLTKERDKLKADSKSIAKIMNTEVEKLKTKEQEITKQAEVDKLCIEKLKAQMADKSKQPEGDTQPSQILLTQLEESTKQIELKNTRCKELEDLLDEEEKKVNEKSERVVELNLQIIELREAVKQAEEEKLKAKDSEIELECKVDKLEFKLKDANEKKAINEKQLKEIRSELVKITSSKEENMKELEFSRSEVIKISSEKEEKMKKLEELRSEIVKITSANEEKEKELESIRSQLVKVTTTKEEKEQTINRLTVVLEKTKVEVEKTLNQSKQIKAELEVKNKRISELEKQSAARSVAAVSSAAANSKQSAATGVAAASGVAGPSNQSPVKMKPKGSDERKPVTVKTENSSDGDNQASKSKKLKLEEDHKPVSTKSEKHSDGDKQLASGSKKPEIERTPKKEDNIETQKMLREKFKNNIRKFDEKKKCKEVNICPPMRMNCVACKEYITKILKNFERKHSKLVQDQYQQLSIQTICNIFRDTLLKECHFKPEN